MTSPKRASRTTSVDPFLAAAREAHKQHTSGPWIAPYIVTANEYHVRAADRSATYIGRVAREADAALIAAAPDLLAAACDALRVIGALPPDNARLQVFQNVEAAIAKAEGRPGIVRGL